MCHIQGRDVCEQIYIGESRRNVELRWEEQENTFKDSEPAKHLKENLSPQVFLENFVCSIRQRIRKILEASEIALKRPSLIEQIESKRLLLFRDGVTWELYNF